MLLAQAMPGETLSITDILTGTAAIGTGIMGLQFKHSMLGGFFFEDSLSRKAWNFY